MIKVSRADLSAAFGNLRVVKALEEVFTMLNYGAHNTNANIANVYPSVLQYNICVGYSSTDSEGGILVTEYIANGTMAPTLFMGVNTENGVVGYGPISGIDTTGVSQGESWSLGDVLYVSGANGGDYTIVPPALEVVVGFITKVDNVNGAIFINRK